jgi:DNA-binding NarL/FixJ family response regulator
VTGEWIVVRRTEAARKRLLHLRRADDGPRQGLSERQRQIMALAADGMRNAQIAATLRISSSTVSRSIQRCLPIIGLSSRAELSLVCGRRERR